MSPPHPPTHAHPPPPPRGSSASHPQTVNQLLPIHRELRLPAASAATHTAANPCWQVEDVTLSFDSAASHNNLILFIFKVSGRARRPSFTPWGIGWETVQILRWSLRSPGKYVFAVCVWKWISFIRMTLTSLRYAYTSPGRHDCQARRLNLEPLQPTNVSDRLVIL